MVGWREETNGWNVLKPWIVPSRQRRNLVALKQFRDVNMCIYIYNHIYIYCIDRVVSTTIWVGPKWYAPNSWSTWLEHTWLDSGGPIFKQTQTCKWGWVRSYDVPSCGVYIYIWIYTNIRYMYLCLLMFIQKYLSTMYVCVCKWISACVCNVMLCNATSRKSMQGNVMLLHGVVCYGMLLQCNVMLLHIVVCYIK